MRFGNLLERIPAAVADELFETLAAGGGVRIERILSFGQSSPAGSWYDQTEDEWVMVLRGRAGLEIEGEREVRVLGPGDWIDLPARCRHRVAFTSTEEPTVWLAVHRPAAAAGSG